MKDKVQQQRFSRMVQDVHEESRVWITKDNLNQKINEDLFETEATTGLVTRSSQHWRYYALTYQFGPNMLDPDGTGDVEDEEDMDDEASRRAARNLRKMTEEDFPEDRSTKINCNVIKLLQTITGPLSHKLSCVVRCSLPITLHHPLPYDAL